MSKTEDSDSSLSSKEVLDDDIDRNPNCFSIDFIVGDTMPVVVAIFSDLKPASPRLSAASPIEVGDANERNFGFKRSGRVGDLRLFNGEEASPLASVVLLE